MDNTLTVKPIAYIKTEFSEKFGVPRQSGIIKELEGVIVFEKEFRDGQAIRCLDEFSHIWLLWGFSHNDKEKWSHTVRPPKMGGNKRVGVFSSRSPFRPNPIGLSSVEIKKITYDKLLGPLIYVSGADMVNNTPIYDIKPYLAYSDSHPDALGGYSKNKEEAKIEVIFPDFLKDKIPKSTKDAVLQILKQDPHPSYKNDSERIYNLCYSSYDIKFRYENGKIIVCDIN